MKEKILMLALALAGLLLLTWGALVPSHLRAVDAQVLQQTGKGTPSLVDAGMAQLELEKVGSARLLMEAAYLEKVDGVERLFEAGKSFAHAHPELLPWGGGDPYLDQIFGKGFQDTGITSHPVVELLLPRDNREALGRFLATSRRPGVLTVLRHRSLTNAVHFSPVASASGQPLETAILLTGLLLQEDHLSGSLRESLESMATAAARARDIRPMEDVYLDIISLGLRFNWIQMRDFMGKMQDVRTLHDLAYLARAAEGKLPILFGAVHVSAAPAAVARYLMHYGKTGLEDLGYALGAGEGALRTLLHREERVYYPAYRPSITSHEPFFTIYLPLLELSAAVPLLALLVKYGFFLAGGFVLARAWMHRVEEPSPWEPPRLYVKQFSSSRQGLFAVFFLLVAILFCEPFLAQDSPTLDFPLRLQFPMLGGAFAQNLRNTVTPMLNALTILALVMFLVIQLIIYILCLIKLAEIRRQPISSELKLRLLENEENMFDAGLYCGLGGTVASLVLLAMGIIKPSLMAAYSSTLFGILFVAILKIFHLRPLRRQLILESQTTEL